MSLVRSGHIQFNTVQEIRAAIENPSPLYLDICNCEVSEVLRYREAP